MANNFDLLKMVNRVTILGEGFFNAWLADEQDRLQRIEEGGLAYPIYIPGAISAGRKLLFPVPTKLVKASIGFTVDGTVTTKIIIDVFTGADRDTTGTSVWASSVNRPEIDTPSVTGFSGYQDVDAGLPFDPGATTPIAVLGIEVVQGAGPTNMTVLLRGEPGA